MAIRSTEFVGIAEGIKSHELSTKGRIESLRGAISELSGVKMSLDSQISYLEAALAAAYEDTDEDGDPDYGRISVIEFQISSAECKLSEIEGQLDTANGELSQSQAELESVMEEKSQTLFEIQERARKTSQNISVAGGMYGAYSGVGSSLQNSMQTSLTVLSQAATILDGSVDGAISGSGGGCGRSSTGIRGITSQGELSTSALSAFAIGSATSSILSGNTSLASAPSNFTTEHTSCVTPATTPNFQVGQKSINPQKTLNFKSEQGENSYATSSFSESEDSAAMAQSENYLSSQSSPNMETRLSNKATSKEQGKSDSARGDLERRRSWAQQYKVGYTPTATSPQSNTASTVTSAPDRGQRELADELERGFVLGDLASKLTKGKNTNQSTSSATHPKSSEDIRNDFLRSLQTKVEPVIRPVNSFTNSSGDDDDISIGARVREKRNDQDYERGLLSKFGLGFKLSQSASSASVAEIAMKPHNQILAGKLDSHNQFKTPRSLTHTAESWKKGAGNTLTYNTPIETGKKLDIQQGKVDNFEGTCGLVSCVNVLRMAGVPITEADVVKYASTTYEENTNTNAFVAFLTRKTLCVTNSVSSLNGGTSASSRNKILEHFGIPGRTAPQSIETIAEAVSSGHGVIASVHAETLYFKRRPIHRDLHAITITSVQKDTTGKILGFYVCDSNAHTLGGTGATYYTAEELEEALSERECNITTTIIR